MKSPDDFRADFGHRIIDDWDRSIREIQADAVRAAARICVEVSRNGGNLGAAVEDLEELAAILEGK